jgi:hypothetical protein
MIYRGDHRFDRALDSRPARRAEDDDREPPANEVLLVLQVRVGGDQDREAGRLGGVEQFAVLQLRPTALERS